MQVIDLRPVYHRLEERIRAHVILCWLALLLILITAQLSTQIRVSSPPNYAEPQSGRRTSQDPDVDRLTVL
jgi:transposase